MPSDITTPAPAAAVSRLTLSTESARGTEASVSPLGFGTYPCACVCACVADDAE